MAKKKRDEAEIEATRRGLPLLPPEDVLSTIKARQMEQVLVYRAGYCTDPITELKEQTAYVTCTSCGKSFHAGRTYAGAGCHNSYAPAPFGFWNEADNCSIMSGDSCTCPECGAKAKALHISAIGYSREVERTYFMTVHNVRGHFAALGWVLFKNVDKTGRAVQIVRRYEGIIIIDGRPIRYAGHKENMGGSVSWSPTWEARAKWTERGDEWDADEIFIPCEEYEASSAAKSALDVFIRDKNKKIRVGAYLELWTKYPQIENLVRCGLSKLVAEMIEDATSIGGWYREKHYFNAKQAAEHFNVKEVKPHLMLGVSKEDLRIARKCSLETFEAYKVFFMLRGIRLTEEQLAMIDELGAKDVLHVLRTAERLGVRLPVVRTLNYIKTINEQLRLSTSYLIDYWKMVHEVQETLPEALIFPRDLRRAHDEAVLQGKVKTDQKTNAGISKHAGMIAWMTFEDPDTGLMIRPAESQKELIKEGEILNHCVRTYAEAVSRGETSILLIRHMDDPGMPFFTLEYRDGKVIQNRGRSNCARTAEIKRFEEKWLEYINSIMEANYGKRNTDSTAAVA